MNRKLLSARWPVLIGALMIQLILGTVYGYSIFWKPLTAEIFPPVITEQRRDELEAAGQDTTSYVVVRDPQAADRRNAVQEGYVKTSFSICVLAFAVVMVLAGRLQDLHGPRFPAMVGAALMGTAFILAACMNWPMVYYLAHFALSAAVAVLLVMVDRVLFGQTEPGESVLGGYVPYVILTAVTVASLFLANRYVGKSGSWDKLFLLWGSIGFLAGAGLGFAFVGPMAALAQWFPERKGLVHGMAVAAFSVGAYFFKGDPYVISAGWFSLPVPGAQAFLREHGITGLFLVHGLVCLGGVTLGALLLRNPAGAAAAAGVDSRWEEVLRRPSFQLLWVVFFGGATAGLMVVGIAQTFVAERGAAAGLSLAEATEIGATAVGYFALFNALGCVLWGLLSDRAGRALTLALMFFLQAGTMLLLEHVTGMGELCIVVAAVGFNFGGVLALFPSTAGEILGAKNLGANYGWLFTSYGIAAVAGIAAGNLARSLTGSYDGAFTFGAALCLVSAVIACAFRWLPRLAPGSASLPTCASEIRQVESARGSS